MELKYKTVATEIAVHLCFNRTFMELKYRFYVLVDTLSSVLIVPLWNWNVDEHDEVLCNSEF